METITGSGATSWALLGIGLVLMLLGGVVRTFNYPEPKKLAELKPIFKLSDVVKIIGALLIGAGGILRFL